nr:ribonuclease H-like domain-containing protein [Tanacetum cinerariifolium]
MLQGIPTASYGDPPASTFSHFIEFGDSYKAPPKETGKGPASKSSAIKKGMTVAITTKDMQKRRNDVKARTTLLLALPDEYQLRFSNGKGKVHTASVPTASNQVSTASTNVAGASLSHDTICLSQVEARLVKFKENEVKFCERIKVLERDVEIRDNKIEYLRNELEQVQKEKESLDNKLTDFRNASKDIDNLLGSQRLDKNKEGLGYSAVPPPHAQIYSPPKKDLSWTGLPEFVDDTITDYRDKGKAVKALACWIWRPKQNISKQGPNCNGVSGNPHNNIDDKGYWNSGCSRHMTGNISYLYEYEPYDGGYVSFGHGGGKITGKGIIKTGKLEFKNVYFVKELKYNLFSVSQICDNKNSVLFTDFE